MLSPALTRFIANVYLVALMRENCRTQFAECRRYGVQIKFTTNMPTLKLQSRKSDVDANGKLILLGCATFVFSKLLNSIGFHLVPFFLFDNHISHENSCPNVVGMNFAWSESRWKQTIPADKITRTLPSSIRCSHLGNARSPICFRNCSFHFGDVFLVFLLLLLKLGGCPDFSCLGVGLAWNKLEGGWV